ncbi:MAG: hypothetical protein HY204_01555 [Nitrospirae bacterium]|nr:hypothetical protein [Nitrospirota bacterium]
MEHPKSRSRSGRSFALTLLIAGAFFITAPISAWALHLGIAHTSWPAENVRNTLHNLSTSNPVAGTNIGAGGSPTTEVCVFCHTPHGANVGTAAAPLWNRAIPTSSGYSTYTSPNFDQGSAGQPMGVSLACLSCHDGVAALDAFINGGGSGKFFGKTNTTSTGAITKPAGSAFLDLDLSMEGAALGTPDRTDTGPNYGTILGGAIPFPNLTKDLSDDHPISFPMPAGDPQFSDVLLSGALVTDGLIQKIGRTGALPPQDRRDALRLYPASGGSTTVGTWVECASCHNPHAPRPLFLRLPTTTAVPGGIEKGGGTTTVGTVLGIIDSTKIADNPNAGSAVCLSCHEK